MKQWIVAGSLVCIMAGTLPGGELPQRYEFRAAHMGTLVEITLYASTEDLANRAARSAFARIEQLDGCLSDYRSDSELRRLCAHFSDNAWRQPALEVSDDLFEVLHAAGQFSGETDGAFDITVGPLSRLWRRARRQKQLPEQRDLAAALEVVGHDYVRLDPQAQSVRLLRSGMRLDAGGIGKGFAADAALAALGKHGFERALVNLGGDLAIGAPPPAQSGWRIAMSPFGDSAEPHRQVQLAHCSMATSGDAARFVELGDQRYSHIIDPRTGMALTDRRAVTVIAADGMTADALASALSVLGADSAPHLVKQHAGATAVIWEFTAEGLAEHTFGAPLDACRKHVPCTHLSGHPLDSAPQKRPPPPTAPPPKPP